MGLRQRVSVSPENVADRVLSTSGGRHGAKRYRPGNTPSAGPLRVSSSCAVRLRLPSRVTDRQHLGGTEYYLSRRRLYTDFKCGLFIGNASVFVTRMHFSNGRGGHGLGHGT